MTKLHLYITVGNDKVVTNWNEFYSSDTYSTEDLVDLMFDKSIAGYYVSAVESSIYTVHYNIKIRLGFSEGLKTNIDASVVQEVAQIAGKTSKPFAKPH